MSDGLGGQGTYPRRVTAVVWLQAIFVVVQAVQIRPMVVLPPLSSLISLISLGCSSG